MRVSEEERSARDVSLRNKSAFRLVKGTRFSGPSNGGSEEGDGVGLALIVSGTVLFSFLFSFSSFLFLL